MSTRQGDVGGDAEESFPRSAEQAAAERRVEARRRVCRAAASAMMVLGQLRLACAALSLFPLRRAVVGRRHRTHLRQRRLLRVHLA